MHSITDSLLTAQQETAPIASAAPIENTGSQNTMAQDTMSWFVARYETGELPNGPFLVAPRICVFDGQQYFDFLYGAIQKLCSDCPPLPLAELVEKLQRVKLVCDALQPHTSQPLGD